MRLIRQEASKMISHKEERFSISSSNNFTFIDHLEVSSNVLLLIYAFETYVV
jgi:hypothetical protein